MGRHWQVLCLVLAFLASTTSPARAETTFDLRYWIGTQSATFLTVEVRGNLWHVRYQTTTGIYTADAPSIFAFSRWSFDIGHPVGPDAVAYVQYADLSHRQIGGPPFDFDRLSQQSVALGLRGTLPAGSGTLTYDLAWKVPSDTLQGIDAALGYRWQASPSLTVAMGYAGWWTHDWYACRWTCAWSGPLISVLAAW